MKSDAFLLVYHWTLIIESNQEIAHQEQGGEYYKANTGDNDVKYTFSHTTLTPLPVCGS